MRLQSTNYSQSNRQSFGMNVRMDTVFEEVKQATCPVVARASMDSIARLKSGEFVLFFKRDTRGGKKVINAVASNGYTSHIQASDSSIPLSSLLSEAAQKFGVIFPKKKV